MLERLVDALGLPYLLDGAGVVAGIGDGGLLRAQDERLQRRLVREPVVSLHMLEGGVEQAERWPGIEEVVHVRVPRAVEAREEREPRIVVEEHEASLVDRDDRNAVVA